MYIFRVAREKRTFYFQLDTADHIGVGFFKYLLYPQKHFIIFNRAFVQILGYSSKKEFGKSDFFSLFSFPQEARDFLRQLKAKKRVRFFETRFKKKEHSKVWVAISAVYIKRRNSEYIEGIVEDISAHRRMEEKLALEKDYMQNLLDNIPDAIYFKDKNNRIVKVNKFYAQGVGLPPSKIIGKTDFDFFPKEQAEKMAEDDNYVLTTGKPIVGKVERTLLPNGTWNQVITTKIPTYDRRGKIIGTMGITRDMTAYANLERDRLKMVMDGLNILVKALEMRDPYTFGHTRGVANIVEHIGKELGWDESRILGLKLAAELHDLGKISIPMDILNKPGKLTKLEFQFIQEHVSRCYDLIKDIRFPFPLADTIYQHHERLDGSGYPNRLKGEDILFEARVLAASDVLEALTSHRPYRAALGIKRATEELHKGAGVKYDKEVVEIILKLLDKNHMQPFWAYD